MPVAKPVWGPASETVANDKLNQMVTYADEQAAKKYEDAGDYDSGQTYAKSAVVTAVDGLKYASLQNGNIGHNPRDSPTYWEVFGGGVSLPDGGTTGQILAKASDDDGDAEWVDAPADGVDGDPGTNGWSPVFATATDGARRVLQVVDWVGGTGTMPDTGKYVGVTGFEDDIADGVDVRGPVGDTGAIDTTLEIPCWFNGAPASAEPIFSYLAQRDFDLATDAAGSIAFNGGSTASDAECTVLKNGLSIGTLTFPSGAGAGVFDTTATSFTRGERLVIYAPITPVSGLQFININIQGTLT